MQHDIRKVRFCLYVIYYWYYCQRWSRKHKARGQGREHKKIRGQGQTFSRPRTTDTSASALRKKRSSQKVFRRSPENVFQKIFQALHKLLTTQRIVLSSSRGQGNFPILEASRPRPRTSKCVLEDSTSDYCSSR